MLLLILFLSIIGYCIFVSSKLKLSIEHTPIIISSSIILLLYVFALLNALKLAAFLVLGLGIIVLVYSLLIYKRNLLVYLTPGFTAFICLFVLLWLKDRDSIVLHWDEFSHWALVVKDILHTNQLADSNSAVHFKDYPPGLSLYQYFFSLFMNSSEGGFYFARNILLVSAAIPVFKGVKWNKIHWVVIVSMCYYFLFTNYLSGFDVMYVDAVLSAFFGFSLVQYFVERENLKRAIFAVFPQLCVLPLLKSTGLMLCIFASLIILIDVVIRVLIQRDNNNFSSRRNNLMSICFTTSLILLFPLIIQFSWSTYVANNNLSSTFDTTKVSANRIMSSFSDDASEHDKEVIKAFKIALDDRSIGLDENLNVKETVFFLITLHLLLLYLLYKTGIERRIQLNLLIGLFLGFILYSLGLLLLYMYSFSDYEGLKLASYERYMSIYLVGWFIIIFSLLVNRLFNFVYVTSELDMRIVKPIILVLAILLATITPVYREFPNREIRLDVMEKTKVIQTTPENSKIYIVWQNTSGYEFWMTSYELIPRLSNTWGWSLGTPYYDGDIWTTDLIPNDWAEQLLEEEYDYVFIGNGDDMFWSRYGDVFESNKISASLFKENGWGFSLDKDGYKSVLLEGLDSNIYSLDVIKYDGSKLRQSENADFNNYDQNVYFNSVGVLYLSISDEETGWYDDTLPWVIGEYELSRPVEWPDMIKAFFNGWKWIKDSNGVYWQSINDASLTSLDVDYVISTNLYDLYGIEGYKITYTEPDKSNLFKVTQDDQQKVILKPVR